MNLEYLIREPKVIKDKNPLLVLLHGYGSNEEDLFSFAQELPDDYFVISLRAPYALQPYAYAWYAIDFDANQNKFSNDAQAIESRDLIVKFIDEIGNSLPVDKQRIVLLGFSQGSILSMSIALSYPDKVNRVVALSGYLNENILKQGYENADFSNTKFFVSHGTVDQVIPVEWSRKSVEKLQEIGINVVNKEYPVGHGVAPKNFFDLKDWLLKNI